MTGMFQVFDFTRGDARRTSLYGSAGLVRRVLPSGGSLSK
jgi:hypothetical protein